MARTPAVATDTEQCRDKRKSPHGQRDAASPRVYARAPWPQAEAPRQV